MIDKESKLLLAGNPSACAVYIHVVANSLGYSIWKKNKLCLSESNNLWLQQRISIKRIIPKPNIPIREGILSFLLRDAGKQAAEAITKCDIYELAMALNTHFGWQIANGGVPPPYGRKESMGRVFSLADDGTAMLIALHQPNQVLA